MCETKPNIKFGTDGWRGIISDNFTFENVRRVAQAIADYYNREPNTHNLTPKIAVGYDTRFLSEKYAQIVTEVLTQNGIDVVLSNKAIPTPALSFAVKQCNLTAGVMITASHNPPEYNGIKIKNAFGGAAGSEVTQEVERLIDNAPLVSIARQGVKTIADFTINYVRFLRKYIDITRIKNSSFKILVDPMHGSGNSFIADVLKGTRIRTEFTREDINPSFENLRPEPLPENLFNTQKKVKSGKFDLCLILDGDADRIAAFTGNGEFISPQKILGLLILHLVRNRKMSGSIVKTIVGTNMLDKITAKLGLKLYETPVGFKHISELMNNEDILTGGEEAGGIGFKNYIPERDGTLAGLLLLEMMSYRKKNIAYLLKEMEDEFGRYYYWKDDFKLKGLDINIEKFRNIKNLLDKEVIEVKDYDGLKLISGGESWLMFRMSGTEPIVRIYAESKSLMRTKKLLEFGKGVILEGNAV